MCPGYSLRKVAISVRTKKKEDFTSLMILTEVNILKSEKRD